VRVREGEQANERGPRKNLREISSSLFLPLLRNIDHNDELTSWIPKIWMIGLLFVWFSKLSGSTDFYKVFGGVWRCLAGLCAFKRTVDRGTDPLD